MSKSRKPSSKRKISKQQCQIFHFVKSCINRLGKALDPKVITAQIKKGELELLDKQSSRVRRYKYIFNGKEYVICYDVYRKQPITIFPYLVDYNNKQNKYLWWLCEDSDENKIR